MRAVNGGILFPPSSSVHSFCTNPSSNGQRVKLDKQCFGACAARHTFSSPISPVSSFRRTHHRPHNGSTRLPSHCTAYLRNRVQEDDSAQGQGMQPTEEWRQGGQGRQGSRNGKTSRQNGTSNGSNSRGAGEGADQSRTMHVLSCSENMDAQASSSSSSSSRSALAVQPPITSMATLAHISPAYSTCLTYAQASPTPISQLQPSAAHAAHPGVEKSGRLPATGSSIQGSQGSGENVRSHSWQHRAWTFDAPHEAADVEAIKRLEQARLDRCVCVRAGHAARAVARPARPTLLARLTLCYALVLVLLRSAQACSTASHTHSSVQQVCAGARMHARTLPIFCIACNAPPPCGSCSSHTVLSSVAHAVTWCPSMQRGQPCPLRSCTSHIVLCSVADALVWDPGMQQRPQQSQPDPP
eukprot:1156722-Pelagomonas_calceolata.AAC.11